ncbi:hypothetical protein MNBD_NITROSPINAE03-1299 [hydrothermal vent metagenome]|uniref:Cytidylate kinase n=1 Tax=hydrothermal vent metagenome TaxID=652676 RepID=A0A3B1CF15_9ZZZZ
MADRFVKKTTLDLSFYRDWIARREKALEKDRVKPTFFVTISREFGCEGYDLATTLVEKINKKANSPWPLFTRSMIDEMIAKGDVLPDMVKNVSEKRWSFKDWFIDALVPDYLQSSSSRVYEGTRNLIFNFIAKGNCVILGSGSQTISSGLDPGKFIGVHIRLAAPYNWRLARIEQISKCSRDEAEKTIKDRQGLRDKFISDFTGMDAADLSLYNIVFNNAKNTPGHMADMIVEDLRLKGAFKD